jgi:hypothetical protein
LLAAFGSRREFQESLAEPSWGTVVWFADEPNHLVNSNGGSLFGPSMTWQAAEKAVNIK